MDAGRRKHKEYENTNNQSKHAHVTVASKVAKDTIGFPTTVVLYTTTSLLDRLRSLLLHSLLPQMLGCRMDSGVLDTLLRAVLDRESLVLREVQQKSRIGRFEQHTLHKFVEIHALLHQILDAQIPEVFLLVFDIVPHFQGLGEQF